MQIDEFLENKIKEDDKNFAEKNKKMIYLPLGSTSLYSQTTKNYQSTSNYFINFSRDMNEGSGMYWLIIQSIQSDGFWKLDEELLVLLTSKGYNMDMNNNGLSE